MVVKRCTARTSCTEIHLRVWKKLQWFGGTCPLCPPMDPPLVQDSTMSVFFTNRKWYTQYSTAILATAELLFQIFIYIIWLSVCHQYDQCRLDCYSRKTRRTSTWSWVCSALCRTQVLVSLCALTFCHSVPPARLPSHAEIIYARSWMNVRRVLSFTRCPAHLLEDLWQSSVG